MWWGLERGQHSSKWAQNGSFHLFVYLKCSRITFGTTCFQSIFDPFFVPNWPIFKAFWVLCRAAGLVGPGLTPTHASIASATPMHSKPMVPCPRTAAERPRNTSGPDGGANFPQLWGGVETRTNRNEGGWVCTVPLCRDAGTLLSCHTHPPARAHAWVCGRGCVGAVACIHWVGWAGQRGTAQGRAAA